MYADADSQTQTGDGLTITPIGLHSGWPAGLGWSGLAFNQLDLDESEGWP